MRRALRALARAGDGVGDWALAHTPRIVITDTYQVMFAFALLGMGLASFVSMFLPGSHGNSAINHTLPDGLRILWSLGLALGGFGQLIGLQWTSRDLERAGITLSGIGCLVYATALAGWSHTWAGYIIAFVFFTVAGAYFLRLKVSSVAKRLASKLEGRGT